jgi:hypothetical protein
VLVPDTEAVDDIELVVLIVDDTVADSVADSLPVNDSEADELYDFD